MRKCIRSRVDKKKLIIEAINSIDENENNEENNDENNEENNENNEGLNDLHEEDLIGYVIFSINSRMPKKCQDCREWYKTEMGKKPEMSCNLCDTGMHGCNKKDTDISALAGLCNECLDTLGKPGSLFAIKTGLIIASTVKKDERLNEDENSETNNNRTEEKVKENNIRRRKEREREIREMNRIEFVEVQAEIHREPTQREPQNEIIMENMEIVGDEQTEIEKKRKIKNKKKGKVEYVLFG